MDILTPRSLRELAATRDPHCVSIYLPTHRTGRETRQDPLRLKKRTEEAQEELIRRGMRSAAARDYLQSLRDLLVDDLFWAHQADGLAIFLTPTTMLHFRLPRSFEDLSVVGDRFHITPLFPILAEDTTFFILALSPKRVRFLQATRDTVERYAVDDLPADMGELVQYIDAEKSLQFHTKGAPTAGTGSQRAARFHGQGVGTDRAEQKVRLLEFCQMTDSALQSVLAEQTAPLVLAADESLIPIYRQANSYPNTLDASVTGNPDELSDQQLRDAAWPILRQQHSELRARTLADFYGAIAKSRASSDPKEILPAAADGRIAKLLVSDRQHLWGEFDCGTRKLVVHESRQTNDRELINFATGLTYLNGGDVLTFAPDELNDHGPAAAVYRY